MSSLPDPIGAALKPIVTWCVTNTAICLLTIAVAGWGFVVALGDSTTIEHQSASQSQLKRTQAQLARVEALQTKQLLQGCQRQNALRLSDNNAHFGDYVVFSFVAKRFLVPTPTETSAQKKVTDQFAGKLQLAVADSSWTPPTDCKRAVSRKGSSYTSPPAVPFTTRLPPPSALPPS